MISNRPSGAITSRSAATIGAILATSSRAGSTIEKSGGRAAIAGAMFGIPPCSTGSPVRVAALTPVSSGRMHIKRRAIDAVDTIYNGFPYVFNLELDGDAVGELQEIEDD